MNELDRERKGEAYTRSIGNNHSTACFNHGPERHVRDVAAGDCEVDTENCGDNNKQSKAENTNQKYFTAQRYPQTNDHWQRNSQKHKISRDVEDSDDPDIVVPVRAFCW
jgi:hypothetical protein